MVFNLALVGRFPGAQPTREPSKEVCERHSLTGQARAFRMGFLRFCVVFGLCVLVSALCLKLCVLTSVRCPNNVPSLLVQLSPGLERCGVRPSYASLPSHRWLATNKISSLQFCLPLTHPQNAGSTRDSTDLGEGPGTGRRAAIHLDQLPCLHGWKSFQGIHQNFSISFTSHSPRGRSLKSLPLSPVSGSLAFVPLPAGIWIPDSQLRLNPEISIHFHGKTSVYPTAIFRSVFPSHQSAAFL